MTSEPPRSMRTGRRKGIWPSLLGVLLALTAQIYVALDPSAWWPWLVYGVSALAIWGSGGVRRSLKSESTASATSLCTLPAALGVLIATGCTALTLEWSTLPGAALPSVMAWIAGMGALALATWRSRFRPGYGEAAGWTGSWRALGLLAIMMLAFSLRVLWIAEIPRVYFGDESRLGMWLRDSFQAGVPPLFRMGWNTWSMIGLSLQGMFAPVLGLSTLSLRLASALFGTLAVAATFLLTRELFDTRTGLIAAFLLAVNRTAIDFSRLGTTHTQAMLFEALAFYALWRACNTGSALAYAGLGIASAFCLHAYNAAHAVPALLLGWWVLTWATAPRAALHRWRGGAVAALSFLLVSWPWLFYLTDAYQFTQNWLQFTWMARARQVTPQILAAFEQGGASAAWPLVSSQIWKTWLGFLILPAEAYQLGYRGGGMLDHVGAALFVLGIPIALRSGARGAFVLYWWLVTALTGGALTIDPPAFVRLVGVVPAVCILAALPLRILLPDRNAGARQSLLSGCLLAILLSASLAENWRTYFREFGASSAEEISELVHFVRRIPPTSPVFLLGADNFLHFTRNVDVEQFAFDFPDRTLVDVPEPAHFLPLRERPPGVPTYLVLGPTQLGLEPYVRRLYPHTQGVDVRHKANRRLFFRYLEIPPQDILSPSDDSTGTGLDATYERDGELLVQRVDPQLNFYTLESFFRAPPRLSVEAPFRATWRGGLKIEQAGIYRLEVDAGGPFEVVLDGLRICLYESVSPEGPAHCELERQLEVGVHPIEARWEAWTTASSVRLLFQMYWTPPGGKRELVPPWAFQSPQPPDGASQTRPAPSD